MDRLQHYYGSLVDCWLATNEGWRRGHYQISAVTTIPSHAPRSSGHREIYLIVTITDWENADLYKGS